MTKLETLIALRDKVQAGDSTNDGSMFRVFGDSWTRCFDAFHGSLDAAKALHEAVSPEYRISLYEEDSGEWRCLIGHKKDVKKYFEVWAETPSRALLLADIEALIAKEDGATS